MQLAFEAAGADARIHVLNALLEDPRPLEQAAIIALPGGFSYGDDLGAGRMLALTLGTRLGDRLREHLAKERLLFGVCNGFQALLHAGLLTDDSRSLALVNNSPSGFRCEWASITADPGCTSPIIKALGVASSPITCPIAHAEGRIFARQSSVLDALEASGQIAFRYASNPNGSARNIAGISNRAGTALGLMPHPEGHIRPDQHPRAEGRGMGLPLFQAMIRLVA